MSEDGTARRGLLDTNTLILLPRIDDVDSLPDEPLISTITLAELSVGPLVARSEAVRMIAAIAIAHGLPLHTCNPDDVMAIDGLEVQSVTPPDG